MKSIIANLTAEQRDRARRIIAHGDNEYSLMTLREPEPAGNHPKLSRKYRT